MSDLRKAAEMALEVFDGPVLKDATEHTMRLRKACDLLRQALAESENSTTDFVEPKSLAQPEQEQYVTKVVAVHEDGTYTTERIPLPKREWVGITYDEVYEFVCTTDSYINFAKAIEAKLKEKNGA